MLYTAGGFRYDFLYDHPAITYEVRKAPIPMHNKLSTLETTKLCIVRQMLGHVETSFGSGNIGSYQHFAEPPYPRLPLWAFARVA